MAVEVPALIKSEIRNPKSERETKPRAVSVEFQNRVLR
jgi:hypothetical protein